MVAAYLARYLTKSTEDFGLDDYGRVHSAVDARYLGASPHAARIIETAEQLAATDLSCCITSLGNAPPSVAVGADLLPAVPLPAWTDLLRTRRVARQWPGSAGANERTN
jgi:hypothetical protein